MDSRIVVRNNLSKSKNKYYSKTRLSKSKLDDIDLGSTIGDIYRRSKSKSANAFKKRSNNTFKTVIQDCLLDDSIGSQYKESFLISK